MSSPTTAIGWGGSRRSGSTLSRCPAGSSRGRWDVPSSAIGNIESETVHLNIAQGEVDSMGWRQPPRLPDDLQTAAEHDADREI